MILQAQCAIEVWKLDGERTKTRLNALCEHFARVYGTEELTLQIQQEAYRNVHDWMFFDED